MVAYIMLYVGGCGYIVLRKYVGLLLRVTGAHEVMTSFLLFLRWGKSENFDTFRMTPKVAYP